MSQVLDRAESSLARGLDRLERPGVFYAAVALLLVLAFGARLAVAANATDVCCGHPDSWVYFHQAYVEYLGGDAFPDEHRGSGWQLALFATLSLLGISAGTEWTPYMTAMSGDAARAALVAHTLSAAFSVGAVAATLLLARELVSRKAALLAGALVALDPFLVRTSASAMSEPLYVPLFVLATMTVLRARRHPAWLVATGALMALAHVLRVNGLVMYGALALFGFLLLRVPAPRPRDGATARPDEGTSHLSRRGAVATSGKPWIWGDTPPPRQRQLIIYAFASVATFLLVASPYLIWRETEGGGAFDYGTNQRFWADNLWDLQDPWWQAEFAGQRIERESFSDYVASHSLEEAAIRLWQSATWQIYDLVGSGRYPPFETEGGAWVGSPREESALTPLLAALAIVAAFTTIKRREWLFLPIALGITFLTFLWIYPLVRSVRYFAPLIPLVAIAAVAGWQHLASHVRRPALVGAALFGAYFALYGLTTVLHLGDGVRLLARSADARAIVLPLAALWMLVALAPATAGVLAWARRARFGWRRADEAP